MGRLVEFVRTGSIGPVMLGMSPFDVGEHLGEPSRESRDRKSVV